MASTALHQTSHSQPLGDGFLPRKGLLGWWINLTAPPPPPAGASIAARERDRKAKLTSISILAIFLVVFTLVANGLTDLASGEAIGSMGLFLLIAAILNRTGKTSAAAFLIPIVFMLLDISAIIRSSNNDTNPAGTLTLLMLPAYDLLAIPTFLTSLTANRRAPWFFGLSAALFVVLDYTFQPHGSIVIDGHHLDELAFWESRLGGSWEMINRHVLVLLGAAASCRILWQKEAQYASEVNRQEFLHRGV